MLAFLVLLSRLLSFLSRASLEARGAPGQRLVRDQCEKFLGIRAHGRTGVSLRPLRPRRRRDARGCDVPEHREGHLPRVLERSSHGESTDDDLRPMPRPRQTERAGDAVRPLEEIRTGPDVRAMLERRARSWAGLDAEGKGRPAGRVSGAEIPRRRRPHEEAQHSSWKIGGSRGRRRGNPSSTSEPREDSWPRDRR